MSPITTHVLDISLGKPAAGIVAILLQDDKGHETELARGTTNADGRIADLLPEGEAAAGVYRLRFEVADYFKQQDTPSFYPHVDIAFEVTNGGGHYHVPLLLSPFGYSTYRGS
ncbi:hydroxyisourate hydrolase [Adhaeretor mobilis]|uniref:5-hydroxyisourate hydrolase n=1 Tax=Adhaeretor mobilis TaxID=1930276 RepID=A0A517MQF5_9BACT|nr:hydroxyisourate hydrolase [Adhaeretor mobilis]QDS97104.1 5-hydroxyisourate hydrolase precursor [Adhaeretor mobilis]